MKRLLTLLTILPAVLAAQNILAPANPPVDFALEARSIKNEVDGNGELVTFHGNSTDVGKKVPRA